MCTIFFLRNFNNKDVREYIYQTSLLYFCYITIILYLSQKSKYVLRDKKTNKEIVPWKLVKYHGDQKADVCLDPAEQVKFYNFLVQAANHEQMGELLQNREEKKFGIAVSGIFLSENDDCINLMNPVFLA